MYKNGQIQRRNLYDDRGFIAATILLENEIPKYQDYLTDKGKWKIRQYFQDGHIEVNPKYPNYLLEYEGEEYSRTFSKLSYDSMEQVIYEVLTAYLSLTKTEDLFCVAMHKLHTEVVKEALCHKKKILSFFRQMVSLRERNIIKTRIFGR